MHPMGVFVGILAWLRDVTRQTDDECGTLPHLALHLQGPALGLHQFIRKPQPDAEAATARRARSLFETFKNLGAVRRGDANAPIHNS